MESVNTQDAPRTPYSPRLPQSLSHGVANRTLRDIRRTDTELMSKLTTGIHQLVQVRPPLTRRKCRQALVKHQVKLQAHVGAAVQDQLLMPRADFLAGGTNWMSVWPVLCARDTTIHERAEEVFNLAAVCIGTMEGIDFDASPVTVRDVGLLVRRHAIARACQRLNMSQHTVLLTVLGPMFKTLFLAAYLSANNWLPAEVGVATGGGRLLVPIGAGGAVIETVRTDHKLQLIVHTVLAADQLRPAQRLELLWWEHAVARCDASIVAFMGLCAINGPNDELMSVVAHIDTWVASQ